MTASLPSRAARIRAAAPSIERRLPAGSGPPPAQELRALADELDGLDGLDGLEDASGWDRYGEHAAVAAVERQVAQLLGKPAAAMFPSGIMAQQAVLRCWTDRQGSKRVALPGRSHLLHHELDGPALLHGLQYERLGQDSAVPTADDLAGIPGPLGAVLLELPLRDAGHLLPSWDDLVDFAGACHARKVPLHLDGARLWESTPHLGHDLATVAALADSVYVSFYKGLGGLAGAAVAGPEDLIDEARQWRKRHGGTLFTMMPYAVSALRGLRQELPRMVDYHQWAVDLAARLSTTRIRTFPSTPHTNAFRLYVEDGADALNERVVTAMERDRLVLTSSWTAADVPGWSWTELTVGATTLEWDLEEAVSELVRVLTP